MTERCLALVDDPTLEAISALAERTRLQILFLLGERGRMCVGDIAAHFKISRPAISHHLKILKVSRIVHSEKVGQEVYYSVDMGGLVATLRGLANSLEQCCQSEDRANVTVS
jgi:DNA-binding transcriptional ArsR family regulator